MIHQKVLTLNLAVEHQVQSLLLHHQFSELECLFPLQVLHFDFPMPFLSAICGYLATLACTAAVYFSFPIDWRVNREFRRRLKFYICNVLFTHLTVILYVVAGKILHSYQNEYQPMIALIFVFLRGMNEWMTTKLIKKMAIGDEPGAQGYGTLSVGIRHTMQITYTLGTAATLPTEIFLLGLDFIVNIYLCLKFVWARKRRPEDIESQINLLQELALSELTEFIAPLAFILAFISAYYGPNGELLGNVPMLFRDDQSTHHLSVHEARQGSGNCLHMAPRWFCLWC